LHDRAAQVRVSQNDIGDLPPNSWVTRLTVSAADFATMMPARVEPVKDIMSTSWWFAKA
jgi:hypothetical protein